MSFRFQRRFSLAPWFRLNLSKSGVSASVGPRGADVNSRGTYNVAVPGIPGARFMGRIEQKRFFDNEPPRGERHWSGTKTSLVMLIGVLATWALLSIIVFLCAIS